jgi:hypothetical protein
MLSALIAEGIPPTSPLTSNLSFPSPTRSCHPLAIPPPAATRSWRGARRRSRCWRWHLPHPGSAAARRGAAIKKTLEALAVMAAAAPSTSVAPRATGAPGDVGVSEKRGPDRPKGSGRKTASAAAAAPSSPRRRGRPPGSKNKKAPAALGAIASTSARPRAVASPPVGPS